VLLPHPQHRQQVLDLLARFRGTGLLVRDARDDIPPRLGEFRLRERLGSGGMGVVFAAVQESLGRIVALKVIRPDLVFFAGSRERFRREIEVIARLSHPAIVPIVATGEHDGVPWYAMPLIAGCTADEATKRLRGRDPATLRASDLEQAIRNGAQGSSTEVDRTVFAASYWEACVRLVRQAALGLEHAHQAGIVHRDVKPSNVMLTPDGRALLLDFGLARVDGDAKLTRTGGEPGSPAYMAPEQVRGLGADARADLYSLAATLVQLLDLEPPFGSPDAEQLRAAILRGSPAGVRNRAVPGELRLVLQVAMDLDRERRYPTAAAFAADLDAVLARRPIAARRLPLAVRGVRWLQRHRRASAALSAVALLAVVLPVALLWQQSRSLQLLRQEKEQVERSRDQAVEAVRVFLTRFASGPLAAAPGGLLEGRRLLQQAVELLDQMPAPANLAHWREQRTMAGRWLVHALQRGGEVDAALQAARAVFALWPESTPRTPVAALQLANLRADLLLIAVTGVELPELATWQQPIEDELALAATEPQLAGPVRRARAQLAMGRAEHGAAAQDPALAEQLLRDARQQLGEVTPLGDLAELAATLHNRLGDRLREAGQLPAAAAEFDAALALLTPKDPGAFGAPEAMRLVAYAHWGLARVAIATKRWPEAQAGLAAAHAFYEHSVHAYPDDSDCALSLASVLTEWMQVRRQLGAKATELTTMLERACAFWTRHRTEVYAKAQARTGFAIALQLLSEQYWRSKDAAAMARVARELTALPGADARRHSRAAWRLLQAAELLAAAGDAASAAACDDDALRALLACDAAGWFPPIDLDDPPCRRLLGRAEFTALREKHPPERASRQLPDPR
jgi:serine/threonine protein kinase